MKFDVIGLGALNMDSLYRVNRIAREEEESFIKDFKETPGGSAANTVAGLARLGLKTGYIGKVTEDREGELLLNSFKQQNVDTDGIIVSKEGRSGVVNGYVDTKGERALYVDPGVNDSLEFREVDLEYAGSAEILHFTSFVGEKPFEAQKELATVLPEVKISLDPGELYARKGLASLRPIIKRCSVMFLNENEVRLLTGEECEEGSKALIKRGVGVVAVKLGERGCYITDGEESHMIQAYKVKVVDTTGAGDAFCAGFLYGLIKEKNLYECGRLGNFVASSCIRKAGAREGLPTLSDLHEL